MIERKYKAKNDIGGISYILAIGKSIYDEFRFIVTICTADGYIDYTNEQTGDFDTVEHIEAAPQWLRIY